jgi:hypothetical protein
VNRGIISWRDDDFGCGAIGAQSAFDLFLRRYSYANIPFDDGLASQRISCLNVLRRETQCATSADIALNDLHHTASASPLATTGLGDLDIRLVSSFHQQGARGDEDRFFGILEGYPVLGHISVRALLS